MREADVTVGGAGFEAMGIDELLDLCREAGILAFEELACRGNGAVIQIELETRCDETALDALEYVEHWERVTATENGQLYVISFTAPGLPSGLGDATTDLIGTCDPELGEREATMSLVGPQDAISGAIQGYEAAGVVTDLRRLGTYSGSNDPLDAVTDRQREVLRTAHEMGYYEVPREVSIADIADDMGLDPSTVAEHLQRAERNVMHRLL